MLRPVIVLLALGPGLAIAQTSCPVPEDMATGVRVHISADIYAEYVRDPDTREGILVETYVGGQLHAKQARAAGLYLTSAAVDETRSGALTPLVLVTYDTMLTVPQPESQWSIDVTLSSQRDGNGYDDVWSYWAGPVETITFGDCPVRVFYFDYQEAIAPNDPSRFMYLPDFGFMLDAPPESQDPNSPRYQPIWMEAL